MIRMSLFARLATLVFLFASTCLANVKVASPYFKHLSVDNGLNSRWVNDIAQDRFGFLWVASVNGLQRYDGYQFEEIPGPQKSLQNSEVYDLFIDSKQRLWVTNDMSAYQVNPANLATESVIFEGDQFNNSKVRPVYKIIEGDLGKLWFIRWDGVFVLEQGHSIAKRLDITFSDFSLDNEGITHIIEYQGNYLIGTTYGLYIASNQQSTTRKLFFADDSYGAANNEGVSALNIVGEQLYIGSKKGLFSIPLDKIETTNEFAEKPLVIAEVVSMLKQDNVLWINTYDGLFQIQKDQKFAEHWFRLLDGNVNLNTNTINNIIFDRQGKMWLATAGNGVYYWNPESLSIKNFLQSENSSLRMGTKANIWSFLELKDTIWVGTEQGLVELDKSFKEIQTYQVIENAEPRVDNAIYDILHIDGLLWLSTYDQVRLFNPESKSLVDTNNYHSTFFSRIENTFFYALAKIDDSIWVAHDNGFSIYNLAEKSWAHSQSFKVNNEYFDIPVKQIRQDEFGTIWLGTAKGAFSVDLAKQSVTLAFQQYYKLSNNYIYPTAFHRDSTNSIWITWGGAGLFHLGQNEHSQWQLIKHYTLADGLSDLTLFSAIRSENDLWISSHLGISRLNIKTNEVKSFTAFDGLSVEEFNENAYIKLNDGNILFGSVNGFSVISKNTEKPKLLSAGTNLHISKIEYLNQKENRTIYNSESFIITPEANDFGFKIHLSDFDFFERSAIKFLIKVKNNGDESEFTAHQNILTFFFSTYGKHQVQISKLDEVYSAPLILEYEVPYPWYQTRTALFSFALVLILTITIWVGLRRKVFQNQLIINRTLQEAQQRLESALAHSESGVWDWSLRTNQFSHSRFNTTHQNASTHSFNNYIELIHPDDRNLFIKQWKNFSQLKSLNFACTYRIKNPQGDYQWFQDRGGITERNDIGVLSATGTYFEVSEQKLKHDREELLSQTFISTTDAIAIINNTYKIITVNPAFEAMTGYSLDTLINSSLSLLTNDHIPPDFYHQVIKKVESHGSFEGECWLSRNSAKAFPAMLKAGVNLSESTLSSKHFFLIWSDISAIKEAEYQLRQLANFDPLTKLPNRNLLNDRLEHALERAIRLEQQLAVLFIDLDHFKTINDTLGHRTGDLVLIEVAARISHCLSRDDTIARIGGDEFVVLVENLDEIDQLHFLCHKLIEIMAQPFIVGAESVSISPSIGIAIFPNDGHSSNLLMKHADTAMYHAKSIGRNNFQFFTAKMNAIAKEQLRLEQNLRQALVGKEFYPVFQPRYCMRTHKMVGFEVLLRWQRKNGGHISPEKFIPVAEKMNLILPITEWLLDEVMLFILQNKKLLSNFEFAFNLSARHFINYDIVKVFKDKLKSIPIDPSKIEFEITEGTIIQDIHATNRIIDQLKNLGCMVSVDDFGTGYSSLNYLKDFHIDRLKIDKSFIDGIQVDNNSEAIVDTVIMLAKNLNLEVVAEGIESVKQHAFLKSRQCDFVQGYLFAKPINKQTLIDTLKHHEDESLPRLV